MKLWTCGSSPLSGSPNAWKWINNVNGAIRLSKFWNLFGAIRIISCRDWWSWTKPDYITMTRRQSNIQWSGGIAAHPAPKNSECKNSLEKFSPRFLGINMASSSLIIIQRAKLLTRSITHLCWCNWRTFWRKKRHRKITKGVLFLHDNAPAHLALATQKKLAYLGFQCLDHSPYSPHLSPSDYHLFLGLKKTIESSPFFIRRGGHCCRGDLVGWTTFWIFFFEWLAKVRATG